MTYMQNRRQNHLSKPIHHTYLTVLFSAVFSIVAQAGESMVVVESGEACQYEPGSSQATAKSDAQIEREARTHAKQTAAARVATRIRSTTSSDTVEVKNAGKAEAYTVGQVLYSAYVNADVKELADLESAWRDDALRGRCFSIRLRVEVIPQADALATVGVAMQDDPSLPLNVRLWSERGKPGELVRYRQGESMRLYLRGNKPFYARVLYRMADGQTLQLLPNAHRKGHYFQGGTTYVIPSGEDDFELKIEPPFGGERITVYASEQPLGDSKLHAQGELSESSVDLMTMP